MKKLLLFVLLLSFKISHSQNPIVAHAYTGFCPAGNAYCVYNLDERDTAGHFYIDNSLPNNIWKIGTPSKTLFNAAYSPALALVTDTVNPYPANNISSFIFEINSDDYTWIYFWHRINVDSLSDGGVVEYSTDGGNTWMNVVGSPFVLSNFNTGTIASNGSKAGFTGTSDWIQSSIFYPAAISVKFRFTFTSDNNNTNKDGWIVDDIEINCLGTGIAEKRNNLAFRLFPNPAHGILNVEYKMPSGSTDSPKAELKIYNVMGREVMKEKINSPLSTFNFQLPAGVYFVKLTDGEKHAMQKLIIE